MRHPVFMMEWIGPNAYVTGGDAAKLGKEAVSSRVTVPLPCDPASPLLAVCSRPVETQADTETCANCSEQLRP